MQLSAWSILPADLSAVSRCVLSKAVTQAATVSCRLATGVAEGDLSGDTGNPAVRSMCNELVSGLQTIAKVAPPADQQQFQVR